NTPISLGSYLLTNIPYYVANFVYSSDCRYEYSNTISGKVTIIKLDRLNYVIAGTFDLITYKTSCDTLKITNGRFDIKYIP
ncbi:MAG: hypothetical protein ORN54_15345, partial [Cyclobacteriaceae bacterium]|nr:hypothetical protein [Cyclobacteriaceae bacterium]